MHSDCGDEAVAYSVQDLGGQWRWRVYRGGGQVLRQGVEATAEAAQRAAAALIFGGAGGSRSGAVLRGAAAGRGRASTSPAGRGRPAMRSRERGAEGTRPAPETSLSHV